MTDTELQAEIQDAAMRFLACENASIAAKEARGEARICEEAAFAALMALRGQDEAAIEAALPALQTAWREADAVTESAETRYKTAELAKHRAQALINRLRRLA